jgi:hypothetical protein
MAAAINWPRRNTLIWHSLQTGKCFSGPRASHRYCACFCPYLESPKIRRLVLLLLLLLFFNLSFAPFLFFASRRLSPSSQSWTSLLLQTLLSLAFSSLFFFFFFSFDFCLLIQTSRVRSYCCFCCRDFVAVLWFFLLLFTSGVFNLSCTALVVQCYS